MADEVVEAIGSDKALAVKADAAKLNDMHRLVDETIKRFGKIDIVVAAAGVLPLNTLDKLTEEEFDKVMNINVKGPMFLVQVCIQINVFGCASIRSALKIWLESFNSHAVWRADRALLFQSEQRLERHSELSSL